MKQKPLHCGCYCSLLAQLDRCAYRTRQESGQLELPMFETLWEVQLPS